MTVATSTRRLLQPREPVSGTLWLRGYLSTTVSLKIWRRKHVLFLSGIEPRTLTRPTPDFSLHSLNFSSPFGMTAVLNNYPLTRCFILQGVYKLSQEFAKPYFHKYWTEIHDVTIIWKGNVCSFIVTLNAFDVRPTCDTADVQAILPFPPNPLKHVLLDVPVCGVDALSQFW